MILILIPDAHAALGPHLIPTEITPALIVQLVLVYAGVGGYLVHRFLAKRRAARGVA
jgi:hypothetical protein